MHIGTTLFLFGLIPDMQKRHCGLCGNFVGFWDEVFVLLDEVDGERELLIPETPSAGDTWANKNTFQISLTLKQLHQSIGSVF